MSDTFHGLEDKLKRLNLANNLLGDSRASSMMSTDELRRLVKLEWLSLARNKLRYMEDKLLNTMQKLKYLDLSENLLQFVPIDSLVPLKSLVYLDLSGNRLITLDHQQHQQQCLLPMNIRLLNLSNNQLSTIKETQLLQQMQQLKFLNLSNNNIRKLTKLSFESMSNNSQTAFRLDLSHNLLDEFPGDALLNFHQLSHLSLAYNRISYIENGYVSSVYNLVDSLRYLDLTGNLLQLNGDQFNQQPASFVLSESNETNNYVVKHQSPTFKLGAFSGLNHLEVLKLGVNRLSPDLLLAKYSTSSSSSSSTSAPSNNDDTEEDVLDHQDGGTISQTSQLVESTINGANLLIKLSELSTDLKTLDLSDNRLTTIPIIKTLSPYSPNELSFLLNQTSNNETQTSNIIQQQHDTLSQNTLEQLLLDYNSIETFTEQSMSSLVTLVKLSINHNLIKILPVELLRRFSRLVELSVNNNRIKSIDAINVLFENSRKSLKKLDLSFNRLTQWPALVQSTSVNSNNNQPNQAMEVLSELNLANNQLSNVTVLFNQLNMMQSLKILDLSYNFIIKIHSEWFKYADKLEILNLNSNYLQRIDLGSFSFNQVDKLRELHISKNRLRELPRKTFDSMASLLFIDLSHNQLESIKNEAFTFLDRLERIKLNNNKLTIWKEDYFQYSQMITSNLIDLDLSYNQISHLRPYSFSLHSNLKRLNLAHNRLAFIPNDLFKSHANKQQNIFKLEELDVSHNRLQILDNIQFKNARLIRSLDFSFNELQSVGRDIIRKGVLEEDALNDASGKLKNTTTQVIDHNEPLHRTSQQINEWPALSRLRSLNLAHNQIQTIKQSMFNELSSITQLNLNLSHNFLEDLPFGLYTKLIRSDYHLIFALRLESLDLSHNRLMEFPQQLLNNHYSSLESIDISHNRMQRLPPNTNILINIKKLNLAYNPFNIESNNLLISESKSARHLNLASTRNFASYLSRLQQVSGQTQVSTQARHKPLQSSKNQTQLEPIDIYSITTPIEAPYLISLNLSSNQLQWIAPRAFDKIHRLQELDLSNNLLTRLHLYNSLWSNLGLTLENLYLGDNRWTHIDEIDFAPLQQLQSLKLDNLLMLTQLDCRFLSNLKQLKSISMFNYPRLITTNLASRKRLIQHKIPLSLLASECYQTQQSTTNQILHTIKHQLTDAHLEIYDLQAPVTSVNNKLMNDTDSLLIGSNAVELSNQLVLSGLASPKLRKLSLSGQSLVRIKPAAFQGLAALNGQFKLTISFTSLTQIPLRQMSQYLPKSSTIDLNVEHNLITTIQSNNLLLLDQDILKISSIRMSQNPINCDCNLRPFWNWLNDSTTLVDNQFDYLLSSHSFNEQQQQQQHDHYIDNDENKPSLFALNPNFYYGHQRNKFNNKIVIQTKDLRCHFPSKNRNRRLLEINYSDLICASSKSPPTSSHKQHLENGMAGRLSIKTIINNSDANNSSPSLFEYKLDNNDEREELNQLAPIIRMTSFNSYHSQNTKDDTTTMIQSDMDFLDDESSSSSELLTNQQDPLSSTMVFTRASTSTRSIAQQSIYDDAGKSALNRHQQKNMSTMSTRLSSFATLTSSMARIPSNWLTEIDMIIVGIVTSVIAIMSLIIIVICIFKYKMDKSEQEQLSKTTALFNANIMNQQTHQRHRHIDPRKVLAMINSNPNAMYSMANKLNGGGKNCCFPSASRGKHLNLVVTNQMSNSGGGGGQTNEANPIKRTMSTTALVPIPRPVPVFVNTPQSTLIGFNQFYPAANLLMRHPTIRRIQGLASNASDWFRCTLNLHAPCSHHYDEAAHLNQSNQRRQQTQQTGRDSREKNTNYNRYMTENCPSCLRRAIKNAKRFNSERNLALVPNDTAPQHVKCYQHQPVGTKVSPPLQTKPKNDQQAKISTVVNGGSTVEIVGQQQQQGIVLKKIMVPLLSQSNYTSNNGGDNKQRTSESDQDELTNQKLDVTYKKYGSQPQPQPDQIIPNSLVEAIHNHQISSYPNQLCNCGSSTSQQATSLSTSYASFSFSSQSTTATNNNNNNNTGEGLQCEQTSGDEPSTRQTLANMSDSIHSSSTSTSTDEQENVSRL